MHACTLEAEYLGAFAENRGESRLLIGWKPVENLIADKPVMGQVIIAADFDPAATYPIMILSPYATNSANRPDIKVRIKKEVAEISGKRNLFAVGAAVLNHPYWIGVFSTDCQIVYFGQKNK